VKPESDGRRGRVVRTRTRPDRGAVALFDRDLRALRSERRARAARDEARRALRAL